MGNTSLGGFFLKPKLSKSFLCFPFGICLVFDFSILFQILCPALWYLKPIKSANTWQICYTLSYPTSFQHYLPNTLSCINIINVWSLIYLWNVRLFKSKLKAIHDRKSEGKTMATNIQGWKVSTWRSCLLALKMIS